MRTYAAITSLTRPDADVFRRVGYPYVLVSFFYHEDVPQLLDRLGYPLTGVLGDSGAFSVWTRGASIDLAAYTDWCLRQQAWLPDFLAINLDVIPGSPDGGTPTATEKAAAIEESLANADRLRSAGVRVMEVFHQHEPLDYLDRLLDRRQPGEVVGVGGLAGNGSIVGKQQFCDSVFRHVLDRDTLAELPPLHGLGISHDSRLVPRYPWRSVDSSNWATGAKFGVRVNAAGRTLRYKPDRRTKNRTVRQAYISRVLQAWVRHDRDLSRLWELRKVGFAP